MQKISLGKNASTHLTIVHHTLKSLITNLYLVASYEAEVESTNKIWCHLALLKQCQQTLNVAEKGDNFAPNATKS